MKLNLRSFYIPALAALALYACEPKLDAPTPSAGPADFSRYVAFGNSLTAGYADNGLYLEGQLNSYPNILAGQMKQAGGGNFEQPLFSEAQANGSGYLRLAGLVNGLPNLQPVTDKLAYLDSASPKQLQAYIPLTARTPQNLGVPGIRVSDLFTSGYGFKNPGDYNPYFERLQPGLATYTHVAATSQPTFFTSWLGNNDVLHFAGGGGDVDNDGHTDYIDMTSVADFERIYTAFLDSVKANAPNAKGLLSNIPDVTATAYFTTLTPQLIVANAKKINPDASVIFITDAAGNNRPTEAGDLILLTTQLTAGRSDTLDTPAGRLAIAHGFAAYNPLTNAEVLDKDEVAAIATRTKELNALIKKLADDRGLAHWDANAFLNQIATSGYTEAGINLTGSFISGGIFSLDGVHLTPRGYAIAANKMITAINNKYGSNLSTVDISKYRSVVFP